MSGIQRLALIFTIIGAINWGLIGFFQFDLVAAILAGKILRYQESFMALLVLLVSLTLVFSLNQVLKFQEPLKHDQLDKEKLMRPFSDVWTEVHTMWVTQTKLGA